MLFLLFLLFLVSESLLFVSFFWTSFHSLSSPSFGDFWTGFYVPDPCELSFANTLLLSNAAISLGNAFISLEISSSSFTDLFYIFLVKANALIIGIRHQEAHGGWQVNGPKVAKFLDR